MVKLVWLNETEPKNVKEFEVVRNHLLPAGLTLLPLCTVCAHPGLVNWSTHIAGRNFTNGCHKLDHTRITFHI